MKVFAYIGIAAVAVVVCIALYVHMYVYAVQPKYDNTITITEPSGKVTKYKLENRK